MSFHPLMEYDSAKFQKSERRTVADGPPFSLIHTTEPKLLVGKLAVRKELPDAELRFFAGRALFTQNPDLLAL